MTNHALLSLACHGYALAALAYLSVLIRPLPALAWVGRGLVGAGLVLHGLALVRGWMMTGELFAGRVEALSTVGFVTLSLFLALEVGYRRPVMGAFVTPLAVGVLLPGIFYGPQSLGSALHGPLLAVHVGLAAAGLAAFAVATGVAGMYLVMEREAKRKRFGLLFERLPSLQFLDDLHRRLALWGFLGLSLTLVSGAFFARSSEASFWTVKAVVTVGVWVVFGVVLQARVFGGWRGRKLALMTMTGFCVLLLSFISSYAPVMGAP